MGNAANTQFAVAVHAMTLLSAAPEVKQSSEVLAGSIGSNPVHVRRVMAHLRDAGLVESRPGVGGGWRVLKPAGDITLAEVWRAVRGDGRVLGVHATNPDCAVGRRIQTEMAAIDERAVRAVEEALDQVTVEELVADSNAVEEHLARPLPV